MVELKVSAKPKGSMEGMFPRAYSVFSDLRRMYELGVAFKITIRCDDR